MTAMPVSAPGPVAASKPTSMAQALNAALRDALREDERVLVFGEDVGPLGGVFRITDGLTGEFGEERCFDTPLAESGIVGLAVGMAMGGFRPVVEMQFDAFAYPAFEQIASHVAKTRNRTRGRVSLPMVIRIPFAGGIGGVEHHCDSSEAYYAHTPGLKVVTPATVEDAYWLLRDAIDDPDPVIFMEPKKLYWAKDDFSPAERRAPGFGRAVVRREGSDATLVAYGPGVPVALQAAETAAAEGRSLEVVDLRSIVPFDDETVVSSVRRTGRCVVIQEAQGFAGVGGRDRGPRTGAVLPLPGRARAAGHRLRHPVPAAQTGAHPPARRGPGARRGGPAPVRRPARPAAPQQGGVLTSSRSRRRGSPTVAHGSSPLHSRSPARGLSSRSYTSSTGVPALHQPGGKHVRHGHRGRLAALRQRARPHDVRRGVHLQPPIARVFDDSGLSGSQSPLPVLFRKHPIPSPPAGGGFPGGF
ncbi:hypothetical protein GCM10020001_003820 [Nonomuraea salmonea]